MARRLAARFATFWIGSSSSSIAKGPSSSLDSLARFLESFVGSLARVARFGAGFLDSASLVGGVDRNDCSVVLTGTDSTVLEGEERAFLRRGGITTARLEERSRTKSQKRDQQTKANKGPRQAGGEMHRGSAETHGELAPLHVGCQTDVELATNSDPATTWAEWPAFIAHRSRAKGPKSALQHV
jgi:hypothetical protein